MSYQLHILEQRRLIDSDGVSTGASIYFYASGTTTLLPIYSNTSLTTELENPIVVDAGGRIPPIYLNSGQQYRRVIEYGDGSTDDDDPYVAIPDFAGEVESLVAGAETAKAGAETAEIGAEAAKTAAETASDIATNLSGASLYNTFADFPVADGTLGWVIALTGTPTGVYEDVSSTWTKRSELSAVDAETAQIAAEAAKTAAEAAQAATETALEDLPAGAQLTQAVSSAKESERLSVTARTGVFEETYTTEAASNWTSDSFNIAIWKGVGASDTDLLISEGEPIEAIGFQGGWDTSSMDTVRYRVWRRLTTSPDLNSAPGATDDETVFDSGDVALPTTFVDFGGSSSRGNRPWLPVEPAVVPEAGYIYGFEILFEDSSDNQLGVNYGRKVLALSNQYEAGHRRTSDGGSWTTNPTTHLITLAWGTRETTQIRDVADKADSIVPARAYTGLLTELERSIILKNGGWGEIMRPQVPTTNFGLRRIGEGLADGIEGIDFSCRVDESTLTTFDETHPLWNGSRFQVQGDAADANDADGEAYSNFITDLSFYMATNHAGKLKLQDFVMRNTALDRGTAIEQQDVDGVGELIAEWGRLEGYSAGIIDSRNAILRRLYIVRAGQNGVNSGSSGTTGLSKTFIEQCLIRTPGVAFTASDTAHGDGVENNAGELTSVAASTIYMPALGTDYEEPGVFAQVNCFRNNCLGGAIKNAQTFGCLLIGGRPTMNIRPRRNSAEIANIFRGMDRFGPAEYLNPSGPNGIELERPESGETGTWKNVAIFDEYYTDGSAFPVTGNALPASYALRPANAFRTDEEKWGVFDFDKNYSDPHTARFLEILQMFGQATGREILDSNNDLNSDYDLGNLETTGA